MFLTLADPARRIKRTQPKLAALAASQVHSPSAAGGPLQLSFLMRPGKHKLTALALACATASHPKVLAGDQRFASRVLSQSFGS